MCFIDAVLFRLAEKSKQSRAKEEKPAKESRKAQAGNKERALIRKNCKNCGEEFETYNGKKETCSDRCKGAFCLKSKK